MHFRNLYKILKNVEIKKITLLNNIYLINNIGFTLYLIQKRVDMANNTASENNLFVIIYLVFF